MNTNKPIGKTVFVDLDGTLLHHNYDPENIPDRYVPEVLKSLQMHKEHGDVLVCTTSRSELETNYAVNWLPDLATLFDYYLFDLPTGERIVINDHRPGTPCKAHAINVERDMGFGF